MEDRENNKEIVPELAITLPKNKDIGKPRVSWSSIESKILPIDILLVTAIDYEFRSCYFYLKNRQRSHCDGLGMVDFGEFGDGQVKVALIRCSGKGANEAGSSMIVVKNAADILRPKAAICVGCCGLVNPNKAKLGDVVISTKLGMYSNVKVTSDGKQWRGIKTNVSRNMGYLIPAASQGWDAPLMEPESFEVKVHVDAVMLSGPELVNDLGRRNELLEQFPDAIALEMEGEGLFAAASDLGLEWVVVKGISDRADGSKTKTGNWQPFACAMAASVVYNMFEYPDVIQNWPHYQTPVPGGMSTTDFELCQDVIKHGEKRNNRMSLLFIGHCGVGKTSLKKSLLGEESDEKEPSTVGIEFDVVEVNERNVSEAWQRSTDKQYIASEEYSNNFIAKEGVKREIERWKKRETDDGERVVQEKVKNEQEDGDGEKVKRRSETTETTERSIQEPDGSTTDGDGMISTPEKENTFLTDDLKHKIEQAWKNVDNYRDDTMDTIRFLFGDVGGQSVYYDVHSIMLRLRSLFIFVFDLGNPLYGKAQATFVDKETKKKQKLGNPLQETNFDYAKKWMAAVQDLRPQETENPATKAKLPKVLVVFTKADTLDVAEAEQRKAEASKAFSEYFGPLVVAKYTIKNTHPRSEEETRELQELRKKIFETAQEVLLSQDKTPINWLVLERTLGDWMKTTQLRFITLDKAREIGEECEVSKTFGEAIKFFHEENIVVHFDGEKPLSELVVLDPAWLVELLTKVITVRPDRNCGGEAEKAWHDLTEKGVLNFEQLPNPLNEHSHKEALKEMMARARLICHWKDGVYFVPSMVTKAMEKEQIQSVLSSSLQPSLYIVFDGDCIPLGFFTRIQVECITWSLGNAGDSTTPVIFCNFGRFYQKENGVGYSVIFIRHISRIQVAILVEKSIWDSVAKSVLLFLRKTIDDICLNHPSFKSTRVNFGLKCDLCCKESTKCQRHQKETCTDDDCACILHLERFQKGPVICNNNYCGERNVSEHHESHWVRAAGGFKKNAEGESHQEMPSEVSGTCSKFLGKLCMCIGFAATYVRKPNTEFESKPHVFPLVSGNEIVGTAFVLKDRNSKSSRVVSWSAYKQPTCQMIVRDGDVEDEDEVEVRSILLRRERKDYLQVGTLPDGISKRVHEFNAAPSGEEGTGVKILMASRRAVCGDCKGLLVSRLSKICPVEKLPDGGYVRVRDGSFQSFPIGSPLLNRKGELVAIVVGFGGNKITVLSIEQCFRN